MKPQPLPSVHMETLNAIDYVLNLLEAQDARWKDRSDRFGDPVYQVCADPYCGAVARHEERVDGSWITVDKTVHAPACQMTKFLAHLNAFTTVEKKLHWEAEDACLPGFNGK